MQSIAVPAASVLLLLLICMLPSLAAPPVRIAVVAGNASGQEQEAADRISDQLQNNPNVKVNTVNPDWYVVVSINDKSDPVSSTVRVNGTVTVKTTDGHIITTASAQSNKQDFNLTPGTPAPVNRVLVDTAVKEVIGGLVQRALNPIQDAVDEEIQTRDKIINAHNLADEDKYDDSLQLLMTITPQTPHFKGVRELIAEYKMEQQALDLMNDAKSNVRAGKLRAAIVQLKAINEKSKRFQPAKVMIAQLQRAIAPAHRAPNAAVKKSGGGEEIKAIEAQKHALDAQKKALDAQENAIKSKER